jgi:hypothetical protein
MNAYDEALQAVEYARADVADAADGLQKASAAYARALDGLALCESAPGIPLPEDR